MMLNPLIKRHARHATMAIALLACSSVVVAQSAPIKLKLINGTFEVTGALIKFDGAAFVIEERTYGRMTFDATRYSCVAGPCPTTAGQTPDTVVASAAIIDAPDPTIAMRGSAALASNLIPELIRAFAHETNQPLTRMLAAQPTQVEFKLARTQKHRPTTISIDRNTTANGLEALLQGTADLALADRVATPDEAKALIAIAPDLRGPRSEHVIALDGLAIVTHPSRAIASLSAVEISGILSGTIRDWSAIRSAGKPLEPGPIDLIVPALTSPEMTEIRRYFLTPSNRVLSVEAQPQATLIDVADTVARAPNGFGITANALSDNVSAIAMRGSCNLETSPTSAAIKAGDYPLTRRLVIYTAAEPKNSTVSTFVAFAKSDAGQSVARDQRFVDQRIEAMPPETLPARLAHAARLATSLRRETDWQNHARDLINAQRLSATFRFPLGRSELDAKTDQDLTRLAAHIAKPEFVGREILVIGYADTLGRYDLNTTLALNRAQKVRTALIDRGGSALQGRTLIARGHGPHAPVICNDDVISQEINRRVEIWVRN